MTMIIYEIITLKTCKYLADTSDSGVDGRIESLTCFLAVEKVDELSFLYGLPNKVYGSYKLNGRGVRVN